MVPMAFRKVGMHILPIFPLQLASLYSSASQAIFNIGKQQCVNPTVSLAAFGPLVGPDLVR